MKVCSVGGRFANEPLHRGHEFLSYFLAFTLASSSRLFAGHLFRSLCAEADAIASKEQTVFAQRMKDGRRALGCGLRKTHVCEFHGLEFPDTVPQRLPQQGNVNFALTLMDSIENSPCCNGEGLFGYGAMHNGHPVAVHTELTSSWIDHLKAIAFLLAHIARAQLIGIKEF